MSIFHISHTYYSIGHSVVNKSVNRHCHWVLRQDLPKVKYMAYNPILCQYLPPVVVLQVQLSSDLLFDRVVQKIYLQRKVKLRLKYANLAYLVPLLLAFYRKNSNIFTNGSILHLIFGYPASVSESPSSVLLLSLSLTLALWSNFNIFIWNADRADCQKTSGKNNK